MLVRMARATYPHDMLDDSIYGKVVHALDEAGQTAVLKEIESSVPFQTVRGECITGIYNNPAVWRHFGYEGASAEFGGYIDRGFDDLGWLEDA